MPLALVCCPYDKAVELKNVEDKIKTEFSLPIKDHQSKWDAMCSTESLEAVKLDASVYQLYYFLTCIDFSEKGTIYMELKKGRTRRYCIVSLLGQKTKVVVGNIGVSVDKADVESSKFHVTRVAAETAIELILQEKLTKGFAFTTPGLSTNENEPTGSAAVPASKNGPIKRKASEALGKVPVLSKKYCPSLNDMTKLKIEELRKIATSWQFDNVGTKTKMITKFVIAEMDRKYGPGHMLKYFLNGGLDLMETNLDNKSNSNNNNNNTGNNESEQYNTSDDSESDSDSDDEDSQYTLSQVPRLVDVKEVNSLMETLNSRRGVKLLENYSDEKYKEFLTDNFPDTANLQNDNFTPLKTPAELLELVQNVAKFLEKAALQNKAVVIVPGSWI